MQVSLSHLPGWETEEVESAFKQVSPRLIRSRMLFQHPSEKSSSLTMFLKAVQAIMFITGSREASLSLLMSNREFKEIVRIAGVDCDGKRMVLDGLSLVKGIGWSTARALCIALNIPMNTRLGYLSEEEVSRIEAALNNPRSLNIPVWMLNRRRDPVTGEDKHLITSDLELTQKMDIERMMKIKSWKGVRHSLGLKVRGQRTRTTGRTGGPVGFSKAAAAKPSGSEKK